MKKANKVHPVRSKPPQAAAAVPLAGRTSNGVHFIGIGGIGVSALAKYYLTKGWQVSGSDLVLSEITESLKKLGAKIFIRKHNPRYLNFKFACPDLVIYSPAIQQDNPELKEAKKLGIKCQSYPEALGELTKKYFTIAITGTHGKSTTTSMLGSLLSKAGLDPTVIVGTKLKEFGDSNCRVGKSKYLIIEADEHFASFLNYWPKIIVLTRIEADHLDYFKNLKNYLSAFRKFVSHLPERSEGWRRTNVLRLPKDGILIANKNDKNIQKIAKSYEGRTFLYSLREEGVGKLRKILRIPGEHNVSNALAALKVARILKIPDRISFKALSEYRGSWRRFEEKTIKLNAKSYKLINDYGHHPTEIKATLQTAREKYPKKKIWCVYQPHQYQRTYYLFKDFVKVFKEALRPSQGKLPIDKVIITDIYDVAGRENKEIKKRVNSRKLVETIDKVNTIYLPKKEIIPYLKKNLRGGEVIIIMGAGDIYELSKQF